MSSPSEPRPAKDYPSTSFLTITSSNTDLAAQHEEEEKTQQNVAATPVAAPAPSTLTAPLKPTVSTANSPPQPQYASGLKLLAILGPAFIGIFLVALDRTIVATATPRITDEFHSFGDIEWYGSAYMLTGAGFMLFFGRLYTFFDIKWTYMSCIALFEVGSAVCGAAPSSVAFIIGRAISGLGSAGIFNGGITILLHTVPLDKRPLFQSLFAAIFGIASVLGPLLGGVFTTDVTWRWCFYLNLPFGGVVLTLLFFFLHIPQKTSAEPKQPLRKQLLKLDPIGTTLFVGSITCLLLALQWGGANYPWSSGRVIALFIIFAVGLCAFLATQFFLPNQASFPLRLFKVRTVGCAAWFAFMVGGAMQILIYYSAVWLQAIKDVTAIRSGVLTIPMVACMVVGSISAGATIQRTGWLNPFAIGGACIAPIGAGLLCLLKPSSPQAQFQVITIFGFGLGLCMQQGNMAIQAVLPVKDISTGISFVMIGQTLGGAIWIAVAQSVLNNRIAKGLVGIPGLTNAAQIVTTGATDLRNLVAPQYLGPVLEAYNNALVSVFYVGMALCLGAIIGALGFEWKNLKTAKEEQAKAMKAATEAKKAAEARQEGEKQEV